MSLPVITDANKTMSTWINCEQEQSMSPKTVLEELYELLEEYSPA